jgi:hypothetical protein
VYFPNHIAWDSGFFFRKGLDCVGNDVLAHVGVWAREVADLSVTTIPWPPVIETALSRIGDVANVLYCAALVGLLAVIPLVRRRWRVDDKTRARTNLLLWHLAMVVPVAILFGSEPRFRVPYDVFGLALMGWLIAGLITRKSSTISP